MSTAPPPWDPADDADEQYRRASALDPSRPSEATRHAVLSHAARLAAARARADTGRRWLSLAGIASGWRPALAGTLAAAVLAGVVIAPQLLRPPVSPPSEAESAPVAAVRPGEAVRPAAAVHPAEAAPAPAPANAGQRVIVTAPVPRAQAAPTPRVAPVASMDVAPAAAAPAASDRPEPAPGAQESMVRAPLSAATLGARAAPTPPAGAAAAFDPQALWRAAGMGDLTALDAQLARAGDLEVRDAQGRTALLLATLHGQKKAVAELLAHGADPNAADAQGTTPLAAALAGGESQIAAMLRRYGAR